MDIVRQRLESIQGSIRVDSTLGQGTCFTITAPPYQEKEND
jgi:chemotaxis protein histidine kinase CheA